MSIEELHLKAEALLGRLRKNIQSPEDKDLLLAAIDALNFIYSTGQSYAFKDYRKRIDCNDPPPVVASFATRGEAETWLKKHPEPPHGASVLIADKYHTVAYRRQGDLRYLPPSPVLEYYLAQLKREEPPAAVASFNTRAEADAWLMVQPDPPRRAWVQIAGEFHLAVHHPNIHHRALYPLSMAEGFEEAENTPDEIQEPE
jgi:hypothetical protein